MVWNIEKGLEYRFYYAFFMNMEQICFYAKNVLDILIFLNEGSTFLVLNICHIVSYSEYENNEKNVFKIYQQN